MKIRPIEIASRKQKLLIGWNEWCVLPELGIPAIKAKIDTGAKTSAIHAYNIRVARIKGVRYVRFNIHPLQRNNKINIACQAKVVDRRNIMSSNGHIEHRYVISTLVMLGNHNWEIEVTLSNRDPLKFRMLLGREALNSRVIIDPDHALIQGKIDKNQLKKFYH